MGSKTKNPHYFQWDGIRETINLLMYASLATTNNPFGSNSYQIFVIDYLDFYKPSKRPFWIEELYNSAVKRKEKTNLTYLNGKIKKKLKVLFQWNRFETRIKLNKSMFLSWLTKTETEVSEIPDNQFHRKRPHPHSFSRHC